LFATVRPVAVSARVDASALAPFIKVPVLKSCVWSFDGREFVGFSSEEMFGSGLLPASADEDDVSSCCTVSFLALFL
jgi:hypothetical protein